MGCSGRVKGASDLSGLATQLGISVSTVSRILSGQARKYRISRKTEERVLEAARKDGVVVNRVARGLRLKSSQTVGLIIPDVSNPFFGSLIPHVEECARESGKSLLLGNSCEDPAVELQAVQTMLGHRVDGVILAPCSDGSGAVELLRNFGRPAVLLDRIVPGSGLPMVANNNFLAAKDATECLIRAGHRRVGCVRGERAAFADGERVRGYQAAMVEAGLEVRREWVVGEGYRREHGAEAMRSLLDLPDDVRPTGWVTLGTQITVGCLEVAGERELRIPEDGSLVAFDEHAWSSLTNPPLTTVRQPMRRMVRKAFELLNEGILKGEPSSSGEVVFFPSTIVERQSVGPPAR